MLIKYNSYCFIANHIQNCAYRVVKYGSFSAPQLDFHDVRQPITLLYHRKPLESPQNGSYTKLSLAEFSKPISSQ